MSDCPTELKNHLTKDRWLGLDLKAMRELQPSPFYLPLPGQRVKFPGDKHFSVSVRLTEDHLVIQQASGFYPGYTSTEHRGS